MTQGQFTQFRGQSIFGGASYKISYSYQDQQYELSGFFDAIQTQETQLDKHVSMVVKKELEQQILLIPEVPIQLEQFELTFYHNNSSWFAHEPYQKLAKKQVHSSQKPSITYFCNGFQSWTTSREWELEERMRPISPFLYAYSKKLGDYGHYYNYPKKKNRFHSWSFSYQRQQEDYILYASLSEHTGYTLFIHDLEQGQTRISKDCKGLVLTPKQAWLAFDLFFKDGKLPEIWAQYNKLFPPNPSKAKPAIGWTSWYNYYDKISAKLINQQLENFSKEQIPLDIFQIDDGYQQAIGDWLKPNEKFPDGMAPIAKNIHSKGYKAGLWLAPFVASKKSEVFQQHPDWFVQDERGKPLKVAVNVVWGGPYYALDIYNSEVQTHLKKVLHTVLHEWEFDLIKVDFLFAACLKARSDKTRGTIMRDAMQLLRTYAGDKLILACGVPIAPCFQLVDYCRIGNDAHLAWEYKILKGLGNAERPSTWSTLTNTLSRAFLSPTFFLNDPDVFVLREENNKLSLTERYTLMLLNNVFGAVIFTSDDVSNYGDWQWQHYRSIFPHIPCKIIQRKQAKANEYAFEIEANGKRYLLFTNLGDKATTFNLPKGRYFDGQAERFLNYKTASTLPLAPHESKVLLAPDPVDLATKEIVILGGKNHLLSGQEVAQLEFLGSQNYTLTLHDKAQKQYPIYLYVLDPKVSTITVNGQSFSVKDQIAICTNLF